MRFAAVLFFALALGAGTLDAQQPCWAHWESLGGPYRDIQRALDLDDAGRDQPVAVTRTGRFMLSRCGALDSAAVNTAAAAGLPFAWTVLPAAGLVELRSDYPHAQQDGLRWASAGLSAGLTAGAAARWGPVTAMLAPVISFHQNEKYDIEPVASPALDPYSSFYHAGVIDLPRRFGTEPAWWAHPGQSFVRVDAWGVGLGVSTENLRWGSALRNPLLMSSAGAGFPHVFLGTSRPLDVRIGRLEAEAIWGRLAESEHFDTIPDNDRRLFAGLVVAFSPGHTGLTIGVARSYLRTLPPGGLSLGDQLWGPYTGIRDNPRDPSQGDNQLLSAFFRWGLPESGFEVYGEYAREDHWEDAKDLLLELDHSRGYTIGLHKLFGDGDAAHRFRVAAEATNLNMTSTWQSGRPGPTFYTHSQIRQGYTHRGQLLGAPIGPGSDAQYVAADYLGRDVLGGLFVERVRYDNDVYYSHFAYPYGYGGHDAELTLGARGGGMLYGVQLVGELAWSRRHNRDFYALRMGGPATETNIGFTLGAAWVPGAARRVP